MQSTMAGRRPTANLHTLPNFFLPYYGLTKLTTVLAGFDSAVATIAAVVGSASSLSRPSAAHAAGVRGLGWPDAAELA